MCFYFSNSKRVFDLANRYGRKTDIIEKVKEIIEQQYRISAFTQPICPIITAYESIEVAKWGLIPSWTRTIEDAQKIRKMTINARDETVFNLPSFRNPILSQRCLISATGYFEFHHREKSVIPYYIFLRHEEIFSFGGIYEHWQNPDTKEITKTFTIITVPANELCAQIHNGGKNPFRMPLIVRPEDEAHWVDNSLKANNIKQFFQPFDANKMNAYPISKDFTKKRPDDASIIEKAA